ncbi:MAG: hypothetical protein QOH49_4852 [Acidobacteriota bacterium]|jgi:hypothetical protein|nr:hypothetical protein [Acidobacteriota bacterium]
MIKLFKQRVEWKPPLGLFEPAARSAFRVLGLGATAAQPEVFDAASSLRLALKIGVRKTFDGDAAWLGEVARKESDVRDAVGRLSEPTQRARERLYWFQLPAPPAHVSTITELTAAVEELLKRVPVEPFNSDGADEKGRARLADEEAAALHDAALLALAGLVRLDPTLREGEAWAGAFQLWRRLFGCEEFWSLLVALDLKGDYEQPVTFGEVAELRRGAPRVVYAHAAGRARDAVVRGDLRAAAHALELLRGASLPATLLREYEEETVGPAEDKLTEELDTTFTWVGTSSFGFKSAPERRNYCNDAWRRFTLVRPRLADFARLAGADSFYTRRVFEHASSKLFKLAVSFEETLRPQEALFVCLKARALAPPEAEELTTIDAKLVALGAVGELRERSQGEYASALARELEDARVPPKLFRDDPKGGKTLDSFTRKSDAPGCVTSVGFWLVMVMVGVGLRACVGDKPRYTPIYSLPTINVKPNLNFNVNLNYNIPPPLNLSPYTYPSPRGRRRRPPRNVNASPAPSRE